MVKKPVPRKEYSIDINKEWCKGCGICVSFCPENVLGLDENEKAIVINPEKCVVCNLCELRCPDMAIAVIRG